MAYFVYISRQGDDVISIFSMDPETGKLQLQDNVSVSGGPAPMTIDPGRRRLYVGRRGSLEISSFRIDPSTGGLSMIGSASLETDPCYIATDRRGKYLLSSYYEGGRAAVHTIDDDDIRPGLDG